MNCNFCFYCFIRRAYLHMSVLLQDYYSCCCCTYLGYHAPFDTYRHLSTSDIMNIVQPVYDDINLCVGKEWYRYPSEFFLPQQRWHLRYLKSDFKGQLPQPFGNNTYDIPDSMNNMNKEEPSRYVSSACAKTAAMACTCVV